MPSSTAPLNERMFLENRIVTVLAKTRHSTPLHGAPQILHVSVFCSSSDKEVLLCFGKICYGKNKTKGEPDSEK